MEWSIGLASVREKPIGPLARDYASRPCGNDLREVQLDHESLRVLIGAQSTAVGFGDVLAQCQAESPMGCRRTSLGNRLRHGVFDAQSPVGGLIAIALQRQREGSGAMLLGVVDQIVEQTRQHAWLPTHPGHIGQVGPPVVAP